jgi:hypothetical protein
LSDNPNPTEDFGYAHVQKICASANAIWRRLAEKDVGIDGLIEMARADGASLMLGAQVKSGVSYFAHPCPGGWRLYLGQSLAKLYRYTVPVLVIIYNPNTDTAYWASIVRWGKENPDSIDAGAIDIREEDVFSPPAFLALRSDARLIQTPRLSRDRIRDFLQITGRVSLGAFALLGRAVLTKESFSCRTGIPDVDLLRETELLTYQDAPEGGPGFWTPTQKGVEYVEFLLGDRYFVGLRFFDSALAISDSDVDMCEDFHSYIANMRRQHGR